MNGVLIPLRVGWHTPHGMEWTPPIQEKVVSIRKRRNKASVYNSQKTKYRPGGVVKTKCALRGLNPLSDTPINDLSFNHPLIDII